MGCSVDHLSALVGVGGIHSGQTGPAGRGERETQILAIYLYIIRTVIE